MSHAAIVNRFVRDAGRDGARFLRPRSANIHVSPDGRSLYSYGSHFTLARLMPAVHGRRDDGFTAPDGWWLVNGDSYSTSTSQHQSIVRSALDADRRPVMIVSFVAMASAGIDLDTITPVHVLRDREIQVPRAGKTLPDDIAREHVATDVPDTCDVDGCDGHAWTLGDTRRGRCSHRLARGVKVYRDTPQRWTYDDAARLYRWTTPRHVLGEAVFSANVEIVRTDGDGRRVRMTYSASFLSGFDHQETHLHYFLAELPAGAGPWGFDHLRVRSVDDAYRALRPAEVRRADDQGRAVVRQGDIFAVPAPEITDAALKVNGYTRTRSGRLMGGSHVATEVATNADGSRTYARGILHHRPEGFRGAGDPNHRRQTMGDRRTWHLIVRNTVPRADIGATGRRLDGDAPRSWTRGGSID